MRPPSLEHLAAEPVLGTLAVIETALVVLARALRGLHDVDRVARPDDAPKTTAARQLVDDCDLLLRALDEYRDLVYDRLRNRHRTEPDWPF
jgi:hypothetical protein